MIKFLDLKKINERYREEIDSKIKNILDLGCIFQETNARFLKKILQSLFVLNIV